jgi:hypothetical protein
MEKIKSLLHEGARSVFFFFSQKEDGARCLPEKLVRQVDADPESYSKYDSNLDDG